MSEAPADAGVPAELGVDRLGLLLPVGVLPTSKVVDLPGSLRLQEVAWIDGSSVAGEPGTTVLLGHTTAPGRPPAPFDDLGLLTAGDPVRLTTADGSVLEYIVVSVETAPKGSLPSDIFAAQPVTTLVLITCTDAGSGPPGSYRDNLIVRAVPVDSL